MYVPLCEVLNILKLALIVLSHLATSHNYKKATSGTTLCYFKITNLSRMRKKWFELKAFMIQVVCVSVGVSPRPFLLSYELVLHTKSKWVRIINIP